MIVHADLDAFYASVEELDHPELKGHPVAVGGLQEHGIITTANYEARKYGVHSAMPVFQGKRRCPNLIVVPNRRKRYLEKSREVFHIYHQFSPMVEKVSIDEGYLDFSHYKGKEEEMAQALQRDVFEKTGLTVSVGLSYNKFLAKIASDWEKPKGFKVIGKDDVPTILCPLPIEKIHGIGPKSAQKLHSLGIDKVEQLLELPMEFFMELFGKWGIEIYERIRGIDLRPVVPYRERKSLGVERTFDEATKDRKELLEYLEDFCRQLEKEAVEKGIQGYTVTIKVKTTSFVTYTRSKTLTNTLYREEELFSVGKELLEDCPKEESYRHLGITLSNLVALTITQLSFLGGQNERQ